MHTHMATGQMDVHAVPLTRDHRADDPEEMQRIQRMGGHVVNRYASGAGGVARVLGVLAVSRSPTPT